MRLSLTDQSIDEAMTELGLGDPTDDAKPEPRGARDPLFAVSFTGLTLLCASVCAHHSWQSHSG